MRLGGRLQAAIEVLADIEARRRPASEALRDWGLAHRFAGGGDRSAIGNIVYDSLRREASQAWQMGSDEPRLIAFATLLSQWNYTPDGLREAFDGDRHAPEIPASETLEAFSARNPDDAPPADRADIPQWCVPHFESAFGPHWIEEAKALSQRPPLDLRANRLKASRDKVIRQLEHARPHPGPLSDDAIRIDAGTRDARLPNVQAEPAYQKGWFEVQDCGSQAAALLAGAKPGEQVLDLCAGAGGKTLALAARMENKGQVHAHDSDRNRLAPIFERLKRAGTRNVQVHARAAELVALAGRMDLVLVDAPCTGTGTWRRRPDAKWRLDERNLETRIAEQDAVLSAAARYVKPGGRLVYVTCSLLPPENGDRIYAFLARHPEFSPAPLAWDQLCDSTLTAGPDTTRVTLTPFRNGTDGFFVAALARKAAA
jgi:16S rRNA (cytosine967-C5)-methyltransferase